MFDFGFGELLLLAIIALVVLGPERLSVAARLLGRWIRTARSQWNSVKAELENELADEELRRNLREASDAMREGAQQMRALAESPADAPREATPAPAAPTLPAQQPMRPRDADAANEPLAAPAPPPDTATDPAHEPAQLSLLTPDATASAPAPRTRSDG